MLKCFTLVALSLLCFSCAGTKEASKPEEAKPKVVELFNGVDLTGWFNPYKRGEAKWVNGEIHLTTKGGGLRQLSYIEFSKHTKAPKHPHC